MYRNKLSTISWFCFSLLIIYLLITFRLTLVPYLGDITYERNYNLVPFASIKNYLLHLKNNGLFSNGNFTVSFLNLFGNIGLLAPYGFLLPLSFRRYISFSKTVLSAFCITLFIEVFQFLFLVSRRADIDDVIFNTISAAIGYGIYRLLFAKRAKKLKKEHCYG